MQRRCSVDLATRGLAPILSKTNYWQLDNAYRPCIGWKLPLGFLQVLRSDEELGSREEGRNRRVQVFSSFSVRFSVNAIA